MAPPVQRIEDSFVFCDVLRCSGDEGTVTELDEPRRLEHEERAAAVGRIVRDSYTGAVRKIFQVFNLFGEDGHRFQMDRSCGNEFQIS